MRGWLLAITVALTSQAVLAAEPLHPTPESLGLAREVIVASGTAENLSARMQALMEPIMRSMDPASSATDANAREAVRTLIIKQVAADTPLLIDATAQAYAETFTPDELRQLIGFYQSPIGRTLASKQDLLATQMGQATAKLGPKLVQDVLRALCAKTTCTPEMRKRLDAMSGI